VILRPNSQDQAGKEGQGALDLIAGLKEKPQRLLGSRPRAKPQI
jgi:hypothetical protein